MWSARIVWTRLDHHFCAITVTLIATNLVLNWKTVENTRNLTLEKQTQKVRFSSTNPIRQVDSTDCNKLKKYHFRAASNSITSISNSMKICPGVLELSYTGDNVIRSSRRIMGNGVITNDHYPTSRLWASDTLLLPSARN
jgi:hypothetical protein